MTAMPAEPLHCSLCGGTGWIVESDGGRRQARACTCRAAMLRREKLEAAGIPERYQDCRLENFYDNSLTQTSAKETAREFMDSYPHVEAGLLLVGPAGRGKTHLACAVLSELIVSKGVEGLYADFSDLLLR